LSASCNKGSAVFVALCNCFIFTRRCMDRFIAYYAYPLATRTLRLGLMSCMVSPTGCSRVSFYVVFARLSPTICWQCTKA
jgi:hypothetical protein